MVPLPTVRVMVIANKRWEAEPLIHTILEPKSRPPSMAPKARFYDPEITSVTSGSTPTPRLTAFCVLSRLQVDIQIWCIEDWMDPSAGASNTPEKVRVLSRFFPEASKRFGGKPDLVVAFGTAGMPTAVPFNGCAVVGSRVFIHDPFKGNSAATRVIQRADGTIEPMWTDPQLDQLLLSGIPSNLFGNIPDSARYAAEARFIIPPMQSGRPLIVLAGTSFASVGTVNVVNYDDYIWADPDSIKTFRATAARHEIGSVETTHGLIRLAAEAGLGMLPRFVYISGITDSIGYFDMEVSPRVYAQNFAAAHNAGVVTSWLLPEIASQIAPSIQSITAPA
jgi:hypothetical protein